MFMISCGTMPVPSLPQPSSDLSTVQSSGIKSSDIKSSGNDSDISSLNSSTTVSGIDRTTAIHDKQINQRGSAGTLQTIATEGATDKFESELPLRATEAGSKSEEPVIAMNAPNSDNTAEIKSTPALDSQGLDDSILQSPVVSKTQPSQAVLPTAATATRDEIMARANNTKSAVSIADGTSVVQNLLTGESPRRIQGIPKFAVLTANDRVQNAITLLNNGDERHAEQQLADALVIEPNNRAARKLMRQIHETPEDFFAQEQFFNYVMGEDETLISVADKFLEDPLDFYMLAKLNHIKFPNSVASGKRLMIPGASSSAGGRGKPPSSPSSTGSFQDKPSASKAARNEDDIKIERAKVYYAEHRFREVVDLLTPYAKKKTPKFNSVSELLAQSYLKLTAELLAKGNSLEAQEILESSVVVLPGNKSLKKELSEIENHRESERLYRLAVQESQTGKQDQAIKNFAKALELNPANDQAKKQITELRLTVVENYHKQAMVLYRKQELSQAIEIWNNVLKIDPDYELAKQYRARALKLKQKLDQL